MTALKGQSALVTGGGRGFGLAIAQALASNGARVTLTSRSREELELAAAAINASGGTAQAAPGDVTDMASVASVYAAHVAAFGVPQLLVNCAGIASPYGPVGAVDVDAWWNTQAILVKGALSFMRLAIPDMKRARGGRIINIASSAALTDVENFSAYLVGKLALIRLSELAAIEHAADNIKIFPVHPGAVYSSLSDDALIDPEAVKWVPEFVAYLQDLKTRGGNIEFLPIAGEKCVALASGAYDELSGKFIDFEKPGITVILGAI